jgi:hypothetical protein
MQIDRKEFLEEVKLRKVIRKAIKVVKERKAKQEQEQLLEEKKLRYVVKNLINEVAIDDNDPSPHKSTGINVLEDLLKKIIPVLQTDYKKLTSSDKQRKSFRAHMVKAVEDALAPSIATGMAGSATPAFGESSLEEKDLTYGPVSHEPAAIDEEEIDLKVKKPEDDEAFIDVRSDKEKKAEEEEEPADERTEFGITGADETGRNVAFDSFKKVGTAVVDSYDVLGSDAPEDKDLFYDYLITNLKLYFDKFENDLGSVKEPTTDEYEKQKSLSKSF